MSLKFYLKTIELCKRDDNFRRINWMQIHTRRFNVVNVFDPLDMYRRRTRAALFGHRTDQQTKSFLSPVTSIRLRNILSLISSRRQFNGKTKKKWAPRGGIENRRHWCGDVSVHKTNDCIICMLASCVSNNHEHCTHCTCFANLFDEIQMWLWLSLRNPLALYASA